MAHPDFKAKFQEECARTKPLELSRSDGVNFRAQVAKKLFKSEPQEVKDRLLAEAVADKNSRLDDYRAAKDSWPRDVARTPDV